MNQQRAIRLCAIFMFSLLLFIPTYLFAALIDDGSFESAPSTWSQFFKTPCAVNGIGDWSAVDGAPPNFDGSRSLWLGGRCNITNIQRANGASKEITLAPEAALLSFWFNPIKTEGNPQNSDTAVVSLNSTAVWQLDLNGNTIPSGWNNAVVDITQFAGQTATLVLEIDQDFDNDTANIFFDYIEVLHPALQVSQVITPAEVAVGDNFTIQITLENSGDTILENITTTSTSFTNCNRAAGSITSLAPGETTSYVCAFANATANLANTITAQATASVLNFAVTDSDTLSDFVVNPLLALTATPNTFTVSSGEEVSFDLQASNNGNQTLNNLRVTSAQLPGCNLFLNSLAMGNTAVIHCTYAPTEDETLTFTATALEPQTNRELTAETAVSINILPTDPPAIPITSLFLPIVTNNLINHNQYGEPNNSCAEAFPIALNQSHQFLAEDKYDWYKFTLSTNSDLEIMLTNFAPVAGQMTVWRGNCESLTFIGQNGDFSSTKHIDLANQPAGSYYIWIINDGATNSTNLYTLTAATP